VIMGSYGIGVGRLIGCIAEEHHDTAGLIWPVSIAPYQIHLVALPGKNSTQPQQIAEIVYQDLVNAGFDVLYDDRLESPGVKFNDADLLGIPVRVTISARSLEAGGAEVKRRDQADKFTVSVDQLPNYLDSMLVEMQAAIDETVIEVPFNA